MNSVESNRFRKLDDLIEGVVHENSYHFGGAVVGVGLGDAEGLVARNVTDARRKKVQTDRVRACCSGVNGLLGGGQPTDFDSKRGWWRFGQRKLSVFGLGSGMLIADRVRFRLRYTDVRRLLARISCGCVLFSQKSYVLYACV